MIKLICKALMYLCEKTGRVVNITGTGADTDIYMIRYIIARNSYFSIYIHRFLRSDRDDLHDHPWDFWTYMVEGQYWEKLDRTKGYSHNFRSKYTHRFVFRKAEMLHRVELDKHYSYEERNKAPLTFFVAGRKRRNWGFVKDGVWIPWKKYLGLPENTPER